MASGLFSLDTKHGKQKFRTPFSFIKKPPLAWGFAAAHAACAVQYFIPLQTIAEVPEFSSALDFLSDESCRDKRQASTALRNGQSESEKKSNSLPSRAADSRSRFLIRLFMWDGGCRPCSDTCTTSTMLWCCMSDMTGRSGSLQTHIRTHRSNIDVYTQRGKAFNSSRRRLSMHANALNA